MTAIRAVFTARALGKTGLWKVIVSRRKWSSLRGRTILRGEVMGSSVEHLGGTGAPAFPSHFTDGEIMVDMRSTGTHTSLACSKPQALSLPQIWPFAYGDHRAMAPLGLGSRCW